MNTTQQLLQRGLRALDPWLDAAFPIATALICAKQRLAGYSLLAVYLLLRLLQRSDREPWHWILISLLAINAGLIIQDQDIKPGGPSDYLIIAISFSAGYQRTKQQWATGFAWVSSCSIPLLFFSLAASDAIIEGNSSFAGFNINKLGFLAGLLVVASYGLLSNVKSTPHKATASLLLFSALYAAILTESRAASVAPIMAITIDRLRLARWNFSRRLMAVLACSLALSATFAHWYGNSSQTGDSLSDFNRIETIKCWTEAPFRSEKYAALGDGFKNNARKLCGPDQIPSLASMGKTEGLAHAHNLYAQIFNESGIPGLILALSVTFISLKKAWQPKLASMGTMVFPITFYVFLMGLGITYWQVMMINQVLVGYSLAALTATDCDPSSANAAIPGTPPSASAPQG